MAKRKAKSIAKLVEEAAVLLQKIVRMEAADKNGYATCVTCGSRKHWKEMDGGHFVSRRSQMTKLLKENIHAQCKSCNGFLNGNLIKYTLFMQEKYGSAFVEHLLILKNQQKKWYQDEVIDLIKLYKAQIKELENEY